MKVKEHPSRWRIFFSPEFPLSFLCHLFITAPLCSWPPTCSFPFPSVFLPYSTSLSTYILPEEAREITWPLPLQLSASPQPSEWLIVAQATGQKLPAALCFDRGCMPSCSYCHTQNRLFTTTGARLMAWETSFGTVSYFGFYFSCIVHRNSSPAIKDPVCSIASHTSQPWSLIVWAEDVLEITHSLCTWFCFPWKRSHKFE